jgi:hypothetical protein
MAVNLLRVVPLYSGLVGSPSAFRLGDTRQPCFGLRKPRDPVLTELLLNDLQTKDIDRTRRSSFFKYRIEIYSNQS